MGKFLLVNLKGRLVLHGMNALSMARASGCVYRYDATFNIKRPSNVGSGINNYNI